MYCHPSQLLPFFFFSSKSLLSVENELMVKIYLETIATNIDIKVNPKLSLQSWLYTFFQSATSKGFVILFLVDFSDFTAINKLADIVKGVWLLPNMVSVLAVSSGGGVNYIDSLKSYLSLRQEEEIVQFLPFNDEEVSHYIHLNHISIPENVLKPITGNNPYLLSLARGRDEAGLKSEVHLYVTAFVKANLIKTHLPQLFLSSLEQTEKYFWIAANDHPVDDLVEFENSWVADHGVCYFTTGQIKMNFPTVAKYLKEDIRYLVDHSTINISQYTQVRGYIMEEVFFYHLANHKSLFLQNHKKEFTFNVDCVLDLPPKEELRKNVVYRVRRYHPAINAVGIFKHNKSVYLLFFQISKSSYTNHKSKVADLMESRVGRKGYSELTAEFPSFHQYYKSKIIETNTRTTYVYISTETFYDAGLPNRYMDIRKEAKENNIRYALLSKSSDLLVELNCPSQHIS